MVVSAAFVGEGPTLKRWRPRARGRASRINKRTCHITIMLAQLDGGVLPIRKVAPVPAPTPEPIEEPQAEEAEAKLKRAAKPKAETASKPKRAAKPKPKADAAPRGGEAEAEARAAPLKARDRRGEHHLMPLPAIIKPSPTAPARPCGVLSRTDMPAYR